MPRPPEWCPPRRHFGTFFRCHRHTRIGVYDITTQIGAGGMGEAGKLTSGGL
jgi:hypothetical protein